MSVEDSMLVSRLALTLNPTEPSDSDTMLLETHVFTQSVGNSKVVLTTSREKGVLFKSSSKKSLPLVNQGVLYSILENGYVFSWASR